MDKPTPLPWAAEVSTGAERSFRPWIGQLDECRYAALSCGDTRAEAEANASFIVRACNSHDDLVGALEVIAGGDEDVSGTAIIVGNGAATVLAQVRAALAKARGQA